MSTLSGTVERMTTRVHADPAEVNRAVAGEIATLVRARAARAGRASWGWPPAARRSASTTSWSACTATRG